MNKKIVLMLFVLISLLMLSSCNKIGFDSGGGIAVSEEKKADMRMEQIVSALKGKDKKALKSLFSKKALDESNDFDRGTDLLFNFIQGDIESWVLEDGWSSDESIDGGESSLMIRFSFDLKTDKESYNFFIIDYNTDNINTDNNGVYMLEVSKSSYSGEWEPWQKRMRAGISIVK